MDRFIHPTTPRRQQAVGLSAFMARLVLQTGPAWTSFITTNLSDRSCPSDYFIEVPDPTSTLGL